MVEPTQTSGGDALLLVDVRSAIAKSLMLVRAAIDLCGRDHEYADAAVIERWRAWLQREEALLRRRDAAESRPRAARPIP